MQTLYDILEVSPNASPEVIKMAYKALCKKYHPDVYSGIDAEDKMKRINHAYEILSDEIKRKQYDDSISFNNKESNDNEPYQRTTDNINKEDLKKKHTFSSSSKLVIFFICFFAAISFIFYLGSVFEPIPDIEMDVHSFIYDPQTDVELPSDYPVYQAIQATYTEYYNRISDWIKDENAVCVYGWGGDQIEDDLFYVEYAFDEENNDYDDGYTMYCFECQNNGAYWRISLIPNSELLLNKYRNLGYID